MRALIKTLHFITLHGPIAWASNWAARANEGWINEAFDVRPMEIDDVLPWISRRRRAANSAMHARLFAGRHESLPQAEAQACPSALSADLASTSEAGPAPTVAEPRGKSR